jgi:putative heme-binding domain-containing protein
MRRFAAAGTGQDLLTCARLLQLSPTREHSLKLMAGFEEAFKGRSIGGLPDELIQAMARHNVGSDAFKLRTGDPKAIDLALHTISDAKARAQHRLEFIEVLGEVHPVQALPALLQVAERDNNNPALRKAALGALLGYDDARIASTVIKSYSAYPKDLRTAALTLLCSRAGWSWELAQAVEAGRLQAADVPLDAVRQIQRHKGEELAGLVAKHWPQLGRPSTAEMEQQMQRLATVVRGGSGDPYNGQKLFSATCGACHRLFNQGGKIGPDLTPYQRSDLDTLLLHIVNPSAEIREGYENFVIETRDERSLTGFLVERDDHMIVLRGMDGQNVRLPRSEVQELRPAGLSLMPEGLLEGMDDRQVRDLFAYLRSTQPLPN